jgi:hypothetical protein
LHQKKNISKPKTTFTLHIYFVNGGELDMHGDEKVIYQIKDAITVAMES